MDPLHLQAWPFFSGQAPPQLSYAFSPTPYSCLPSFSWSTSSVQPLPLILIHFFLSSSSLQLLFHLYSFLRTHTHTHNFSDNFSLYFIFENNSVASTFFHERRSGKKQKHACCSWTLHLQPNLCKGECLGEKGRRLGWWVLAALPQTERASRSHGPSQHETSS